MELVSQVDHCMSGRDVWMLSHPPCAVLLIIHCHGWITAGSSLDVNSSPPSAAYMRQWTGSALVQIMACRLSGAKPLPEPMLPYCQLDPWEQTSVEFESGEIKPFHSQKFVEIVICEMVAILSRGRLVNHRNLRIKEFGDIGLQSLCCVGKIVLGVISI